VKRTDRIYNGVDFSTFAADRDDSTIREEFGLAPECPLIVAVGNIRKPKGYEYLVRAAAIVRERNPDCRLLIVGHGTGQLLDQLTGLIADLHLDDTVTLTGFRSDIPQILQQSDIFVLSSTSEGLSIATIEAMAVEKPVVVTASGGPQEIVADGETGYIVPPADERALADAITRLINDKSLRDQMGQAARASVQERFSIERNVDEYINVYRSCLRR
jgi:glycosyltransferase involved in cell wall biosynthesis